MLSLRPKDCEFNYSIVRMLWGINRPRKGTARRKSRGFNNLFLSPCFFGRLGWWWWWVVRSKLSLTLLFGGERSAYIIAV